MNIFNNKVAWVVGASSGIGKEMVLQLAKNGAKVILSSRKKEQLDEVLTLLERKEDHLILPLDLEKSSNFDDLAKEVISKYGRIDFLFNNGGLSQRSNAFDTPMDVDRRIMEINYFGNIALSKAVLPYMQKQGFGHLVVISSIAGKFGFFLRSAYSASTKIQPMIKRAWWLHGDSTALSL